MERSRPKCNNCNSYYVLKTDASSKHSKKSLKLPLLLECGHVFCSACLQSLAQYHMSSLPCPECTFTTYFKSGVHLNNQLPLSYFVFGLAAAHSYGLKCLITFPVDIQTNNDLEEDVQLPLDNVSDVLAPPTNLCEECESIAAELKCLKCDCMLCQPCFDKIHSSKVLKSHKAMLLETVDLESPENIRKKERLEQAITVAYKYQKQCVEMKQKYKEIEGSCIKYKFHLNNVTAITTFEAKTYKKITDKWADVQQKEAKIAIATKTISDAHHNIQKRITEANEVLRIKHYEHINEALIVQLEQPPNLTLPDVSFPKLAHDEEELSVPASVEQLNNSLSNGEDGSIGIGSPITQSPAHDSVKINIHSATESSQESLISDIDRSPAKRNLSSQFNKLKSSSPQTSRSSTPNKSISSQISEEEMDKAIKVDVIHTESPSEFYVQYSDRSEQDLKEYNASIKEYCTSNKIEAKMERDTICALNEGDDCWNRCQIDDVKWQSVLPFATVSLIDYGSTKIVSLSSLFSLSDALVSVPPFAVKCTLADVQPVRSELCKGITPQLWTQKAISFFQAVTVNQKDLRMIIKSEAKDGRPCEVDLYLPKATGGESISGKLLLRGFAERRKKNKNKKMATFSKVSDLPPAAALSVGSTYIVDMITATTPHSFYVQLKSPETTQQLDSIDRRITELNIGNIQKKSVTYNEDILVLAPYNTRYYRACIIDTTSRGSTVRFTDYGNTSILSNSSLVPLNDQQLLQYPPTVYHCSLVDITWLDEFECWPEFVSDRFYSDATNVNEPLSMVVMGNDTPLPVKLYYSTTKQHLADILVIENLAKYSKLIPPPPEPLPLGFEGVVVVCHVNTPRLFHIQTKFGNKQVQNMESKFYIPEIQHGFQALKGDYCLALFHADHTYHRALIKDVFKDTYKIFFIDFGNTETVARGDIAPLNEFCVNLPAQALSCSLAGVSDDSFQSSVRFSQLVLEKDVTVVVKDILPNTTTLLVDLYITSPTGVLPVNVSTLLTTDNLSAVTDDMQPDLSSFSSLPIGKAPSASSFPLSLVSTPPTSPSLSPPTHVTGSRKSTPSNCSSSDSSSVVATKSLYIPVKDWPPVPFKAIITAVNDNGIIYGQPIANDKLMDKVNASIQEVLKSHSPIQSVRKIKSGMACIAKFHDEMWYRAIIVDKSNRISVHFADYGNTDYVDGPNCIIDTVVCVDIPMLVLPLLKVNKEMINVKKWETLLDSTVTVQKIGDDIKLIMDSGQDVIQYMKTFSSAGVTSQ